MLNNYWEEQGMNNEVNFFHEEELKKVNLPEWIKKIKCPFCSKELPLRSFRSIQLCLNTRNFGEIAIEVLCDECSKMDTLYFRDKDINIYSFCSYLKGDSSPETNPIIEEDMYKLSYNNIMEKLVSNK